MTYALFLLSVLLHALLTGVSEALSDLTGGRIRKIEAHEPGFAEQLEEWRDRRDSFRAVLRLLLCVLAAVIGDLAFECVKEFDLEFARAWSWLIIIGSVALVAALSELLARLLSSRTGLALLRGVMPVLSSWLFLPIVRLFDKASDTGDDWQKDAAPDEVVSVEDEIMSYVDGDAGDEERDLEEDEKEMIRGILELEGTSVREIMTPRVDLVALPATAGIAEARALFRSSGHSRIPVYGKNLDDVKGILYAKDFIEASEIEGKTLLQLVRPAIFIPETKDVAELLEQIKTTRIHFAVIIDEYGGTSGVITLEDIIEEIVGDIRDEYDQEEEHVREPQRLPDGSAVIDARMLVDDVNDFFGTRIENPEDASTIGGCLCAKMGRIPAPGETYEEPGVFTATVLEADSRTVKKLKLTLAAPTSEDSESEAT